MHPTRLGPITLAAVACVTLASCVQPRAADYDLLIRNASVVDGTGASAYRANVLVKGDTIAVNTKPFGTEVSRLRAPHSGLVVGCTTVPMVLPGQAVCHLVSLGSRTRVLQKVLARQELPFE